MESRIETLLAKYWEGTTSLEEEREIKAHFQANPSLAPEGRYFQALKDKKATKLGTIKHPSQKRTRTQWSVAAAIVIGIAAALLVVEDARQQREFVVDDPKEAYEITRKALLMVSSGLNDGKNISTKELVKINEAQEIIQD
jgi:hypothetical protein